MSHVVFIFKMKRLWSLSFILLFPILLLNLVRQWILFSSMSRRLIRLKNLLQTMRKSIMLSSIPLIVFLYLVITPKHLSFPLTTIKSSHSHQKYSNPIFAFAFNCSKSLPQLSYYFSPQHPACWKILFYHFLWSLITKNPNWFLIDFPSTTRISTPVSSRLA